MTPQRSFIAVVSMLVVLLAGCVSEPGLDKGKFADLDRAARELMAALGSGDPCAVPDGVLQKLDAGTAALQGKTASKAEADLLAAYANLLAISRDGQALCRSRTHLTRFTFVPKGLIYVTQDLDPIVERYGLLTEKHVYPPTGAHWKSISADSIQVIWEKAAAKIRNIEVMLKYG